MFCLNKKSCFIIVAILFSVVKALPTEVAIDSEECESPTGRWGYGDIQLCLEDNFQLNENIPEGNLLALIRLTSEPYFTWGYGQNQNGKYGELSFAITWAGNRDNSGMSSFIGECHKCNGVEMIFLTRISRDHDSSPACGLTAGSTVEDLPVLTRTGPPCLSMKLNLYNATSQRVEETDIESLRKSKPREVVEQVQEHADKEVVEQVQAHADKDDELCDNLTGRWISENDLQATLCIELQDDQDIVWTLLRNDTDTVFVFGQGYTDSWDKSYKNIAFVQGWYNELYVPEGVAGFVGECHKCDGVETITMSGIRRNYYNRPECGQTAGTVLAEPYHFVRSGPSCRGSLRST